MTRIVLADDHPVVREGLKALLDAEPQLRVVGEAADGLEAVKLVEQLSPDVLVLDLMMPSLNGLEVVRQVVQAMPELKVVILSMHATEAYVFEALRVGAVGYVLKNTAVEELVRAIHEVTLGRHYLSSVLSERAIETYVERARSRSLEAYDMLTTREREVLQLAAEGHTNNKIAARLVISSRTVETHRANLMRKLGLRTQTDLVRFALTKGILALDD